MPYFLKNPLMASLNVSCSGTHNFLKEVNKKLEKHIRIFFVTHQKFLNKYISWLINICLKYFMAPAKTLHPPPIYLMYCPLLLQKYFFPVKSMGREGTESWGP